MSRLILALLFLAGLGRSEVLTQSQCSMQGGQWAKLVVALTNRGPGAIQEPRVAFDLTVPDGKVPEVQGWDVGNVSVRLERVSSSKWIVWFTNPIDLPEGTIWNDGRGATAGVHLVDWSVWDPTPSPDWIASASAFVTNPNLSVFDKAGQVIGGPGAITTPPVSKNSSFLVALDPGGTCNESGTVVVPTGTTLAIRCQPADGMKFVGWTYDGTAKSATDVMDIVADGLDHSVRVQFVAKTRVWVHVSTEGQGGTQPSGDVPVYQGDTQTIVATANSGWSFASWSVGGVVQTSISPVLTLGNVQSTTTVIARFVSSPAVAGIQAQAKEDLPRDQHWSKIHLGVRNSGTTTLDAGYSVHYVFRVPEHQTPTVSNWDVPSASTSLDSLGGGYWMLRITSTTALAPGHSGGEDRGWYLGLQTGSNTNWDATGNIALPAGSDWTPAPFITVWDKAGKLVSGSEPNLSSDYAPPSSVMALYKEGDGDNKMLRPKIVIRNSGDNALSDFVFYWYFRTDSAQVPIVTPWYPMTNTPTLEALGNGKYRLRFDYIGTTIPPHTDFVNADGNITGIYLPGYPVLDKTMACSYLPGSTFQPDSAILIYDRNGKLLWGNPDRVSACGGPGSDTSGTKVPPTDVEFPPVIVLQPHDTSVTVGGSASFEVRATGDGELQYQWRRNGVDLTGATSPTLQLGLITADNDRDEYTCAVTNSAGTVVSKKAHIRVLAKASDPFILVDPVDDTTYLGGDASFFVTATGDDHFQYQWFHGKTILSGQNGSRLVIRLADQRDTGVYWVRVTASSGKKIDSRTARLILVAVQPANMSISLSGVFQDSIKAMIPDTSVDLVVRLYTAPEGGTAVWTERHVDVPLQNGNWNLTIGQIRSNPSLDQVISKHKGLYLEVALEGIFPIAFKPRVPVTSVPYASVTGARVIYGAGQPTQAALEGVLYFDQTKQVMWQRKNAIWTRIDP